MPESFGNITFNPYAKTNKQKKKKKGYRYHKALGHKGYSHDGTVYQYYQSSSQEQQATHIAKILFDLTVIVTVHQVLVFILAL